MRGLFDGQEFDGSSAWRAQWVKVTQGKPVHFTSRADSPESAGVHFFRRAYLCAGREHCPACIHGEPRPMVYLFGGSPRNCFVMELNLLAWLRFQDKCNGDGHPQHLDTMDSTYRITRPGVKKTAIIEFVEKSSTSFRVDQIDEVHRLRALSRLFSLQMPERIGTVADAISAMKGAAVAALHLAIAEAERLASPRK
jgi:hypothetical protein